MIVVVGSLNMDLVTRVPHLPLPGETVAGGPLQLHPGGKGGNQAVAAARAGGSVRVLGRVGEDAFGPLLRAGLEEAGVDIGGVMSCEGPSGVALITVDAQGENSIVVTPGANAQWQAQDLDATDFRGASVVVLQLEVPLPTVRRAAQLGRQAGAQVILNAAPAQALTAADLAVDVLVVNEGEAGVLAGRAVNPQNAVEVAAELLRRGPEAVVLTLSARGAVWATARGIGHQPACAVQAVDTTAAGDAFVGALAAALSAGVGLLEAVRWGCAAGALAATRPGAQPSLPTRAELMQLLGQVSA